MTTAIDDNEPERGYDFARSEDRRAAAREMTQEMVDALRPDSAHARVSPPERLAYSAQEVAELLSVGLTTAKALIRSGELRSVKILRCRRVPAAALREYVQRLDAEQNGRP